MDTLDYLTSGTNELLCHPGFVTEDLSNRYNKWNYHWLEELEALTHPDVKNIIKNLDIRLIRYDEI